MQQIHDQDQLLVKAIQAGDKLAFNKLFLKYQYKIFALLEFYVKDRSECSDLVQEVFLKAYKGLYGFKHKSTFYTWLYKITINTAKTYVLDKNRHNNMLKYGFENFIQNTNSINKETNILNDNPDRSISFNELENIFSMALDKLPKELKNAIVLRELDGLSYEEIAEISICPVGTVRSRIFRARAAIEKQVQAFK